MAGLFQNPYNELLNAGIDPQQAQAYMDQQKAVQFAKMSPSERMASGIYGGIQQIARGLGATDPMLKQASAMREMATQFDTTTAQGMAQYAQALQKAGNIPAAQAAAMQAKQLMESEAKVGKLQAETADIESKQKRATAAVKARAAALQRKFPEMSEEEALGYAEDSKTAAELLKTPKEQAKKTEIRSVGNREVLIDKETGEVIKDIGPTSTANRTQVNVGLNLSKPKDITEFRNSLINTVKPAQQSYEAASTAVELADNILKTDNFAASAALATKLAKAAGDTTISQKDVDKYGGDASLIGGVADIASKLATGTPTKDTTRKLKALALLLQRKAEDSIKTELDVQRGLAKQSNFKQEEIDAAFAGIIPAKASRVKTTKSGVQYTVED